MKVIIGAGSQQLPGWTATHQDQLDLLRRNTWEEWFGERRADALLCEHVFEHLTEQEARDASKICFDFLKPGGFLRVAVPDGYFRNEEYQNTVKIGGPGPADHPAAGHRSVFNYNTLTQVLRSAGFSVDVLEYCDDGGRFHFNHWDWSSGPIYRSLLSDHRNSLNELGFVSLIVDAIRPR